MDFGRLVEQARDLWSRPVGKLIFGSIAVFLIAAAAFSYMWTRPTYVALGKFDAANAPTVQKTLTENKVRFTQEQPDFTFMVHQDDYNQARLLLAEANLDPNGAVWSPLTWKGQTTWSDTELDKRQLMVEQKQNELARAIRTLNSIDQAKVQITVPMEQRLFREDEKPVKASVVVLPKQGEKLEQSVVESIMEILAGSVEGLERSNVKVVDSSTGRIVSNDAFKPKVMDAASEASNAQLTVIKQYQDQWQKTLKEQLEIVAGPGNVSVIVTPSINFAQITEEAIDYRPTGAGGKGVVLSEQTSKASSEGGGTTPAGNGSSGMTPNVEVGVPSYPGAVNQGTGAVSTDKVETIVNYLVSQTNTITEKPGGAIDEISVGVMVNSKTISAASEEAIRKTVAMAMGSKARVEVAALEFAPSAWDLADTQTPTGPTRMPFSVNWLYVLFAVASTLGAIGAAMLFFRPRKPVLEPVFAGPEAAMMGGIPVADLEMAAALDAYSGARASAGAAGLDPQESGLPQTPEDVAALAPEEIALLGDEFLQQLGVDPAKVRMREKVEKIAKANPEAVATLLKTWISDG